MTVEQIIIALFTGATVWRVIEPRLMALAETTESPIDNKIVAAFGYVARLVLILGSPLRLIPGLAAPLAVRDAEETRR